MDLVVRWRPSLGPHSLPVADLHKQMGDDQFRTFLKSFQASFRWKYASTKDIVALLQFVTKKDYSPFFEANYWGTGLPK